MLLHEEDCTSRKRKNTQIAHRRMRDCLNPFDVSDEIFKAQYRVSKTTAKYIVDFLSTKSTDIPITSRGIPFHMKVLCTLYFFGHGSNQKPTGSDTIVAMSQPSVSRCLHQTTKLIVEHLAHSSIQFPDTDKQRSAVKQQFYEKCGLPGILGIVDCFHVSILAPPAKSITSPGHLYKNHLKYHSIKAMVVCDSNLRVLFANATTPGSQTDASVWLSSDVKELLETQNTCDCWILGDSEFPNEPILLTPIETPITQHQKTYNLKHENTCQVFKQFLDDLKNRFKCLQRYPPLHYDPERTTNIIYAVLTLHNLCLTYNDQFEVSQLEQVNNLIFHDNDDDEADATEEPAVFPETGCEEAGRKARSSYISRFIGGEVSPS